MRNPWRSALRCEALPGAATIIARSHPLDAAVCNRVSSRAFCAPCRRPAGTVLAPASSAVPFVHEQRRRRDRLAVALGEKAGRAGEAQLREPLDVRHHLGMFAPAPRRDAAVLHSFVRLRLTDAQRRVRGDSRRRVNGLIEHRRELDRCVAAARQQGIHVDAGQRADLVKHRRPARSKEVLDRVELLLDHRLMDAEPERLRDHESRRRRTSPMCRRPSSRWRPRPDRCAPARRRTRRCRGLRWLRAGGPGRRQQKPDSS